MKLIRRWLRRRDVARELELRSLAAMGYDPHNMLLYSANKAYRARRRP